MTLDPRNPSVGGEPLPTGESERQWLHDRRISSLVRPGVEGSAVEAAQGCPVCNATSVVPTFEVEGIPQPIVVCTACGLGRYHPMLDAGQIEAAYPDAYYGGDATKFHGFVELLVRAVARRHVDFLAAGLPERARVLDVGCGRGVLLGPLADRGFEVFGVEMSEASTQSADPRADIRIAGRLGDAGFETASLDQVIIWHVLEHIADPVHTIEECHRILKPGGRLIVAVPNFSSLQARWSGPAWFHLDAPRHLYQFPLRALEKLMSDHGFAVQSEHHFSLRQNPFGWIQSALNRFTGLPTNILYTLMHERGSGAPPPFTLGARMGLWAVFALATPAAIAISFVAALMHSGATVHVIAHRKDD
jgi:2-polyprenyl-3-methyl-5-hydroxy-6-metoxy-1,4-benzoquinol methylase